MFEWFEDPGHTTFVNALLAVVTIGVAVIAIIISTRTQKKLLDIENQREKDRIYQKNKTYLIARGIKEFHTVGSSFYLKIENISSTEAREINVICNNKPVWEHPAIHRGSAEKECKILGSYSFFRYLLIEECKDFTHPKKIEITWTDDSGEKGYYISQISYL